MTAPLATLLSQALIAFTVEHDNEWEWRFVGRGPLKTVRVSLVMWANFLRFVGEKGCSVEQISSWAGYPKGRMHPALPGMIRWRYVTAEPPLSGRAGKSPKPDWLVRSTAEGRRAAGVWKGLSKEIERRWQVRFGKAKVNDLARALRGVLTRLKWRLPHFYPVLDHRTGMRAVVVESPVSDPPKSLDLPALLSQVLHAFTLDFEEDSPISLALRANVIRVLGREGIPVRDLPRLSGISKEAVAMALGFLGKTGMIVVGPTPGRGGKLARLTPEGHRCRAQYAPQLRAAESRWADKYGGRALAALRASLEPILGTGERESLLFEGLKPRPSVWRAKLPEPDLLPHHPMVLHRGGWPDGS